MRQVGLARAGRRNIRCQNKVNGWQSQIAQTPNARQFANVMYFDLSAGVDS